MWFCFFLYWRLHQISLVLYSRVWKNPSTKPTCFLELACIRRSLWPLFLVPLCVFLFRQVSPPASPTSTKSRASLALFWPASLHFSLSSALHLVGSAHKERAANQRAHAAWYPSQWAPPSRLHSDRLGQSGVPEAPDPDLSNQWLRAAQNFGRVLIINTLSKVLLSVIDPVGVPGCSSIHHSVKLRQIFPLRAQGENSW